MASHILVFNDTKEILDLFRDLLSDDGYEVTVANYSIDELPIIKQVMPDLLILDYTVGKERNGWQLLQKVKMVRQLESIPIIICTTSLRLASEIEGYLIQKRIQVVRKPFGVDELLEAVKQALHRNETPSQRDI